MKKNVLLLHIINPYSEDTYPYIVVYLDSPKDSLRFLHAKQEDKGFKE